MIFLVFLVAPLAYAFYLSLFSKGLATGTIFAGAGNYIKAFTDPEFLSGIWFVIRFAVILIPIQMAVSLAAALVLDALTTRLSRFARLAIFRADSLSTPSVQCLPVVSGCGARVKPSNCARVLASKAPVICQAFKRPMSTGTRPISSRLSHEMNARATR